MSSVCTFIHSWLFVCLCAFVLSRLFVYGVKCVAAAYGWENRNDVSIDRGLGVRARNFLKCKVRV